MLSHYKLTTSLTIENGDRETAVWQLTIPRIAADYSFLTHSILAITSLHIAHFSKARKRSQQSSHWNAVAASQMNKALAIYRHEIERVTPKNVAAVFASSALTAIYFIRTSIIDFKDLQASFPSRGAYTAEMADNMMSCVVKTMWGLRGPLEVLMKGWSWTINSSIQPVATRKMWPKMRKPASPHARDEDERLRHIEDLWLQTDRQYDPNSEYLSQALNLLRETYALNSQLLMLEAPRASHAADALLDRGAIFSWVTRIPREYIKLVEAQDRDALVILAHFAVLLIRTDKVWWLEGLGSSFVTAISIALGTENWRFIGWPARISGLELHH